MQAANQVYMPGDQVETKWITGNDSKTYMIIGEVEGMPDMWLVCETRNPKAAVLIRDTNWLDWCERKRQCAKKCTAKLP